MAVKTASATMTRKVDFTTALVVERPTESGPPRTRNPSKHPTWAMMVANTTLLITGLIKSVVFATIIAHVGCLEGFRVRGGPDSVGRSTTSAVVKSTFLVIVADAVFTAIFYFTVKH